MKTIKVEFDTINNIKRLHKGHWFDDDTMIFFKSIVYETVIKVGKKYIFLSSERGPDNIRKYSLREMNSKGNISTPGGFQVFKTKRSAETFVKNKYNVKVNF